MVQNRSIISAVGWGCLKLSWFVFFFHKLNKYARTSRIISSERSNESQNGRVDQNISIMDNLFHHFEALVVDFLELDS